jgi:hypothetical protein
MRAPDKPIARINCCSGYGLEAAAGRIAWYVIYEGPQTVFVDDEGRVFAAQQGCSMMLRWIESHQPWWVGNFTAKASDPVHKRVLDELRSRHCELRVAGA